MMRLHPVVRSSFFCVLVAGFLSALLVCPARGQDVKIPVIAGADSLFNLGVASFRGARYEESREYFLQIADKYPLNQKTTAAAIMYAKSSYRLGDYRAASTELSEFLAAFPTSGYVEDARNLLTMAGTVLNRAAEKIISVGVIFSLNRQEVAQTQAMFNGIRLAVEEYNRTSLNKRIRLIFRDIDGPSASAAEAVNSLAELKVNFIVGTLFSEEAIAAAAAAEKHKIVFVAPMATDERVSAGRRYVFQANPTIRMRGRLMARFAVNGLRLRSFGVIASEDDERVGERMTDSFIEEATQLGADINFISVLSNANEWTRLSDSIPADTLRQLDALYIPVTDNPPEPTIGAIFSSLDRLSVDIRILGNVAYHNLPMLSDASRYRVTYSNDFYVDENQNGVAAFHQQFQSIYGNNPNRLAYNGYDVLSFLLQALDFSDQDDLADVIRDAPVYEGIASRIGFQGGNVNRAMFFHRYSDNELQLLR